MTSYIIAGSSDSEDMTVCENLARKIKSVYSNIEFNFVLKHPSEWDTCIKTLCRHYGFKKQTNPIIFAKTGKLIGSTREFILLAKEKFDIDALSMKPEISHTVNVDNAEKEYYERHRDKTLLERIEATYSRCLENGTVNKIKGYYEKEIDQGIIFYVKNTKQTAPKIHVPQLIKQSVVPLEEYQNIPMDFLTGMTVKRAETADNVKTTLKTTTDIQANTKGLDTQQTEPDVIGRASIKDNITILNAENPVVPELNLSGEPNPEQQQPVEGQPVVENPVEGNIEQKVENQEEQPEPEFLNTEERNENRSEINKTAEIIKKRKGPTDPDFTDLADRLVDNIGDGYYLALHTDPLYEGQTVLFYDAQAEHKANYIDDENEFDPNDNSRFGVYDYSRVGRKRFLPEVKDTHEEEKAEKHMMNSASASQLTNKEYASWMNLEHINIFEPFSEKDWEKIGKVLSEMDSYVYFQILPEGEKNYRSLTDGILNVIPRKFLLLEHNNHGIKNKNPSEDETLPFEGIIHRYMDAQHTKNQKDHLIESLPFKHAFGLLKHHESISGGLLKQIYLEMMITLNERCDFNIAKAGVNLIATLDWMLLIPIFNPYLQQRETKIYLDPLSNLGFVIKPVVEDVWPQTGKLNLDVYSRKPTQILAQSSEHVHL